MKAISLWQPWASLVVVGAKHVETRPVMTEYRGAVCIHATKAIPPQHEAYVRAALSSPPFQAALQPFYAPNGGAVTLEMLPMAGLIGLAWIDAAARIVGSGVRVMIHETYGPQELVFGNYADNRVALSLSDPLRFPETIPCRGQQAPMLWEVLGGVVDRVRTMLASEMDKPNGLVLRPPMRRAVFGPLG